MEMKFFTLGGTKVIPSISLIQTNDYRLDQLQKNIIGPLNNLFQNPFLDGRMISGVALTGSSATSIEHKLGRNYSGYFVTKINANSNVWVSSEADKNLFLKLSCSANCIVDLWVF